MAHTWNIAAGFLCYARPSKPHYLLGITRVLRAGRKTMETFSSLLISPVMMMIIIFFLKKSQLLYLKTHLPLPGGNIWWPFHCHLLAWNAGQPVYIPVLWLAGQLECWSSEHLRAKREAVTIYVPI